MVRRFSLLLRLVRLWIYRLVHCAPALCTIKAIAAAIAAAEAAAAEAAAAEAAAAIVAAGAAAVATVGQGRGQGQARAPRRGRVLGLSQTRRAAQAMIETMLPCLLVWG